MLTILGSSVAPGALDHFLARTGAASQQTPDPVGADRPDNLFLPADGDSDFGTHGRFDSEAKPRSRQLELDIRRPLAGTLARPVGALLARLLS